MVAQFDVWLVSLDPTLGAEIKKTRPCVVIAPDEMSPLKTTLVAPLTSKGFAFPGRVATKFDGRSGLILLDQMRAVDKQRLYKKLGQVDQHTINNLCQMLQEMFAC